MQVVGITTQHEIFVASKEHKFRMNEILVIEDEDARFPKGEVVETYSYNRFIPMGFEKGFVDKDVLEAMAQLGYHIGAEDVHVAKVRLFVEADRPIQTGAVVRIPEFSEVAGLLVKAAPDEGMVLGEIKSTNHLYPSLPSDLQDLMTVKEDDGIRGQEGVPFLFPFKEMQQYPHIGVFGGSGSGKSYGLRVMLEELMKRKIPCLVFDPHYEMNFSYSPGKEASPFSHHYVTVQIGRDVGVDFSSLSTKDVERLLQAAGALTESMVNAIQSLHKKKDSYASFSDRIANLITALEIGKQNVEAIVRDGNGLSREQLEKYDTFKKLLDQYGNLPLASLRGLMWRLERLYHAGLFQHDIRPIEESMKVRKLVVVQGAVWLLQVFASYVIGTLYNRRRTYKDAKLNYEQGEFFPPFVIVTDEAHNFAPKAYDVPTKAILKEIAQEGRKYGAFLILATQRPTLLDETITAQLNSKFVFRTVRSTDIQTIREETDLTAEEAKRLPYLRSGDVFVSSAIFGRTIPVRIRHADTESPHVENPFDELDKMMQKKNTDAMEHLGRHLPIYETELMNVCRKLQEETGQAWDVARLKQTLEQLMEEGLIKKVPNPFAPMYDRT